MGEASSENPSSRWPYSFLPVRMAEGLTGPILPVYAAAFAGASATRIGMMEASFQLLAVLGAFVWGRSSDQVSKRKAFILIGFAGAAISLFGMAFTDNFWVLFAWRSVFGFMAAAYGAAAGALIADESTDETIGSRMGRLQGIGGVGFVLGLVLGVLIAFVRPTRTLFVVGAIFAAVSSGIGYYWIKEPTSHLTRREIERVFQNMRVPFQMSVQRRMFNPMALLHRPRLEGVERRAWGYLLAIFIAFLGTTAGFVLFPLYLFEIGLSTSMIFALFILSAAISAVLFGPAGRLADRVGFRPLQIGAFAVRSLAFLLLVIPFLEGLPAAAVLLILGGVTWAIVNTTGPAALFRGMRIRDKGELIGLYSMAVGLGSLAGALLGGVLADLVGFRWLFVASAGIGMVSVVILARVVYPPESSATAVA